MTSASHFSLYLFIVCSTSELVPDFDCSYGSNRILSHGVERDVQVGETVKLPCSVNCSLAHVKWAKGGTGEEATDPRYIHNTSDHTLTVSNVSINDDSVVLHCIMGSPETQRITYTLKVKLDTLIYIEPREGNVEEEEGNLITIICDASRLPAGSVVYWVRHNKLNEPNIVGSDRIIYDNLSMEHDGNYTCVAEHDGKNASKTIHLHVLSSPKITSVGQQYMKQVGNTVELPCQVEKPEEMVVQWKKDDDELFFGMMRQTRDFRYDLNPTDYTLKIADLKATDDGEYICSFTDREGQISHTVTVSETLQEEDGFIDCTCKPSVLHEPKVYRKESNIVGRDRLIYEKPRMKHDGNDACVAELEGKKIDNHPSEIPSVCKELEVEEDATVELPCKVSQSRKEPVVIWTQGNYLLFISHEKQTMDPRYSLLRNYTLRIAKLSIERGINSMRDEFHCILLNDVEPYGRITYVLKIVPIAKITPSVPARRNEGGQILFKWSKSDWSKPRVIGKISTWTTNNSHGPKAMDDGDYSDHKLRMKYNGFYTCVAKQNADEGTREIRLHVLPRLSNKFSSVEIEFGSGDGVAAELPCKVNHPEKGLGTAVLWTNRNYLLYIRHENQTIDPRYRLGENYTMSVSKMNYSDDFHCILLNSDGRFTRITYIQTSSVRERAGGLIKFLWNEPEVEWRSTVNGQSSWTIKTAVHNNYHQLRMRYNGDYNCVAGVKDEIRTISLKIREASPEDFFAEL